MSATSKCKVFFAWGNAMGISGPEPRVAACQSETATAVLPRLSPDVDAHEIEADSHRSLASRSHVASWSSSSSGSD